MGTKETDWHLALIATILWDLSYAQNSRLLVLRDPPLQQRVDCANDQPPLSQVRVPTRHEEVSVERVPVEEGREASEAELGEDEVTMPVTEDEVVTEKRPMVKEEIRIRKDAIQDEEVGEEDVRREEVDVEDATERGRRAEGETAQADQPET